MELAPLSDPVLVADAIARALDLREQTGQTMTQSLIAHLKTRRLLLILDNCEHLIAACAYLTASLLRGCPSLTILATSREPLAIVGERIYRVPSLALPEPERTIPAEDLPRYGAIRLFVERALLVRHEFSVAPQNALAVTQICQRLEGIPLAIELAAARLRSLSLDELNRRLDDRFTLLTGGDRSALPRQQTLRALMDWSYDLLTAPERKLLGRLSAFTDGWTREAAESVCADAETEEADLLAADILDRLRSLMDKSLILAEERGGATRYRMLETVRQYAQGRLTESAEVAMFRARHRDYFIVQAEALNQQLRGPEQAAALRLFDEERENLRAALTFCLHDTEGGPMGLRLAVAVYPYWYMRGFYSEGRERLRQALEHPGAQEPTALRADALNGETIISSDQGDSAAADRAAGESLAVARLLNDKSKIARALLNQGIGAGKRGDYAAANRLLEEALTFQRETGEKRGMGFTLNSLGQFLHAQGSLETARAALEESLTLRRAVGSRMEVAVTLNTLAGVMQSQEDVAEARAAYQESLTIARELGEKPMIAMTLGNIGAMVRKQGDNVGAHGILRESLTIKWEMGNKSSIVFSLENFAALAASGNDWRGAAALWGAAAALREAIGEIHPPVHQAEYDREVAAVRSILGESDFAAAWEQGRAEGWERAVERLLKTDPS